MKATFEDEVKRQATFAIGKQSRFDSTLQVPGPWRRTSVSNRRYSVINLGGSALTNDDVESSELGRSELSAR